MRQDGQEGPSSKITARNEFSKLVIRVKEIMIGSTMGGSSKAKALSKGKERSSI